jgi:hypothetical protein
MASDLKNLKHNLLILYRRVKSMKGFEARNLRFCSVRDVSVLDENVISILKVRHIVYLLFAAFIVLAGSGKSQVVAFLIALLAVIAAFYPAKAVSFEAYLYGLMFSSFPVRKRVPVKLEKVDECRPGVVNAGAEGFVVEKGDEQEAVEGISRTRTVTEVLRKETRKIS